MEKQLNNSQMKRPINVYKIFQNIKNMNKIKGICHPGELPWWSSG